MNYSLMTLGNLIPEILKSNDKQNITSPQKKLEDLLYAAKKSGIEAVDMTSLEIAYFGKKVVEEILKKNEMKMGGLIYFSSIAIPDFKGDIREEAEQAVDLAKYFNATVLMIVPALVGVEIKKEKEAMFPLLIHNLSVYAEICKNAGVIPVIEDTPDLRIPMCNMHELDAIFEQVPELYMVYDSANMLLVHESETEYFEHFKSLIRHVHLKDMKICEKIPEMAEFDIDGIAYQNVETGTGMVNFPEIYSKLKKINYTGTLVLEYPEFALDREGHRKKLSEIIHYLEQL